MSGRFDADELGLDPEDDQEDLEYCPVCDEPWDDCECEEEDENATTEF